jgi:hypothetical protein
MLWQEMHHVAHQHWAGEMPVHDDRQGQRGAQKTGAVRRTQGQCTEDRDSAQNTGEVREWISNS